MHRAYDSVPAFWAFLNDCGDCVKYLWENIENRKLAQFQEYNSRVGPNCNYFNDEFQIFFFLN